MSKSDLKTKKSQYVLKILFVLNPSWQKCQVISFAYKYEIDWLTGAAPTLKIDESHLIGPCGYL